METKNLKVKKLVIEIEDEPIAPVKKTPATVAPVQKTPAPVAPVQKTPASVPPVSEDKIETPKTESDPNLFLKILGILVFLALIALIAILLLRPTGSTANSTPAPAPIVNPVDVNPNQETWKAVVTSANSNGNFIGDFGGHGTGTIIPSEMTDLEGKTWPVGRVLLTYCEDASTCFYMFGKPGDRLQRAFNVNAYTPEFTGDLANELQYIDVGWNNNVNVTWTPVQ